MHHGNLKQRKGGEKNEERPKYDSVAFPRTLPFSSPSLLTMFFQYGSNLIRTREWGPWGSFKWAVSLSVLLWHTEEKRLMGEVMTNVWHDNTEIFTIFKRKEKPIDHFFWEIWFLPGSQFQSEASQLIVLCIVHIDMYYELIFFFLVQTINLNRST